MTWLGRLSSVWYNLKTLAIRGRFFTGKASFVESAVRSTENSIAEIFENGKSSGQRLLAHYRLDTKSPRTGSQGWGLYCERIGRRSQGRAAHAPAALECRFCGHLFFIHVQPEADPLSLAGAARVGMPASYASEWFSYNHTARRPVVSDALSCSHCEQISAPGVRFIS